MKTSATLRECGCGLRGQGTKMKAEWPISTWHIQSDQSPVRHTSIATWCNGCRRMEWRCQDTGRGRYCDDTVGRLTGEEIGDG